MSLERAGNSLRSLRPGERVELFRTGSKEWLEAQIETVVADSVQVTFHEHGLQKRKTLHVHDQKLHIPSAINPPSPPHAAVSPKFRGLSAGQLETFFKDYCGRISYENNDEGKPICLPTKLAKQCVLLNVIESKRPYPYEPNLYAVNEFFIMPHTKKERISYAELLNRNGKLIDFFISHHWGEDFAEFVQSVLRHAKSAAAGLSKPWQEIVYWCCAFANNQQCISLEGPLEESPFHLALSSNSCRGTVLNLNRMASALFRVWCIYEAYLTHKLGKDFVVNTCQGPLSDSAISQATFGGNVAERDLWLVLIFELLQDLDIETAAATKEGDKIKIMQEVRKFKGKGDSQGKNGAAALNELMRGKIAHEAIFSLAWMGETLLVKKAIDLRADPEKPDANGIRSLTYATAAHGANHDTVKMLLDNGADKQDCDDASLIVGAFTAQLEAHGRDKGGSSREWRINKLREKARHEMAANAAEVSFRKDQREFNLRILREGDWDETWEAANRIGSMGAHAVPAVPEIAELLFSDYPVQYENARKALVQLGEHAVAAAAPVIVAELGTRDRCSSAELWVICDVVCKLGIAEAAPLLAAACLARRCESARETVDLLGKLAIPAILESFDVEGGPWDPYFLGYDWTDLLRGTAEAITCLCQVNPAAVENALPDAIPQIRQKYTSLVSDGFYRDLSTRWTTGFEAMLVTLSKHDASMAPAIVRELVGRVWVKNSFEEEKWLNLKRDELKAVISLLEAIGDDQFFALARDMIFKQNQDAYALRDAFDIREDDDWFMDEEVLPRLQRQQPQQTP